MPPGCAFATWIHKGRRLRVQDGRRLAHHRPPVSCPTIHLLSVRDELLKEKKEEWWTTNDVAAARFASEWSNRIGTGNIAYFRRA